VAASRLPLSLLASLPLRVSPTRRTPVPPKQLLWGDPADDVLPRTHTRRRSLSPPFVLWHPCPPSLLPRSGFHPAAITPATPQVVLLDNDMVVVRNIDSLFSVPAPAGVAEPARVKVGKSGRGGRKPVTPGAKSILCSNGGLQIFVPSEQHLAELESKLYSGKCKSYNEGEQGFLCVAIKRWHEVPYEYDTFVSSWLSDPADFRKARVLHYIMMSSEPDFCYSAFKRGTGCGREARVRFMRPPQMVATFWKMYMAMEAAYGLDLSSW